MRVFNFKNLIFACDLIVSLHYIFLLKKLKKLKMYKYFFVKVTCLPYQQELIIEELSSIINSCILENRPHCHISYFEKYKSLNIECTVPASVVAPYSHARYLA